MSLAPNVGAAALAEADTITATAATLGRSTRQVSRWRSSQQLPDEASRELIARAYGIPRGAWDRTVTPTGAPTAPDAPSVSAPQPSALRETARQRLEAQIARLREQRQQPELSARNRIELEKLELAASSRLARLEGTELTNRQILASVAWARVSDCVVAALEPWPEAMRRVADALDALDAQAAA